MLNCRADLACDPEWGADCEAEVAVVVTDLPARPTREQALKAIRLVTIVNDVSLRSLQPRERETGFGWVHCKPPTAFAPVVATPDELGDAWKDGKVCLPLHVFVNDEVLGRPDAGVGMQFDFAQLIQHGAATRPLSAGTIIGSGTVSNSDVEKVGAACIAERRFIEQLQGGKAVTPYLKEGDRVRIEMLDAQGESLFGDIVQVARQA
jgi:fumarylacetoacetate (FAA) hydrolase